MVEEEFRDKREFGEGEEELEKNNTNNKRQNNMTDFNFKKEADRLMQIKGRTKGSEFKSLGAYILQRYGEKELLLLEKKMAELGYPLHFNEIDPLKWYSESLNVLALIVAKHLFGWKDLFEVGYTSTKFSVGMRLFMRLSSLERILKETSRTWRKFLDVGTLELVEYNKKEKYTAVRLRDYKTHPDMCRYYAGFFLSVVKYTQKGKNMTMEETKCMYKGDPYHEYVARWE